MSISAPATSAHLSNRRMRAPSFDRVGDVHVAANTGLHAQRRKTRQFHPSDVNVPKTRESLSSSPGAGILPADPSRPSFFEKVRRNVQIRTTQRGVNLLAIAMATPDARPLRTKNPRLRARLRMAAALASNDAPDAC